LVKNVKIRLSEEGIGIEFAKLKLMQVLSKNPGYSQIIKICGILSGEISNDYEGIEEFTPEDISCFVCTYRILRRRKKFFKIQIYVM